MVSKVSKWSKLSAVDVSSGVEIKHGGIKYLQWAHSWSKMCEQYPDATYERHDVEWYPDETAMVSVSVTADGQTHRMWLPVMDMRMKAMKNPDARAISDNVMRCLVKACGMHGLGLSLWRSEEANKDISNPNFTKASELLREEEWVAFHEFVHGLSEHDQKETFNAGPPGAKTAFKTEWREGLKKAEEELTKYTDAVKEAIADDDAAALAEIRAELTPYEGKIVAGRLSTEEQQRSRELKELSE
jgi:hypothetical protein